MSHDWWESDEAWVLYWGEVNPDDAGLVPKLTWTHDRVTQAVLVPLVICRDDNPDLARKFAEAWRRWRLQGETPEQRRATGRLRLPYDFASSPDADRTIRARYAPISRWWGAPLRRSE